MSPLKEVRYTSRSITPPPKRRSSSISPPRARARSRSRSQDPGYASNPGNNLYITGLSTRVTTSDLEEHFSKEGKVRECEVVLDPRSRESRGFAFVTMESVEDADRCIKHLNRSVLEGRLITVEKAKRKCGRTPTPLIASLNCAVIIAKRKCGRTPTPGHYYGSRDRRDGGRRRSRSHSPYRSREREHSNSRSRRERSRSPYDSNSRSRRERSRSPYDSNSRSRRERSRSPYNSNSRSRRKRSRSPYAKDSDRRRREHGKERSLSAASD